MNKLLYLGLGAVGLYILIGGLAGGAGGTLLPILVLVGVPVMLYLGNGSGKGLRGSWGGLLLIFVVLFVIFGFSQKAGIGWK